MKTIFKICLAAIVAFTVVLSSCGKYPDGPKISLKSKTARLCRVWKDPNCSSCGTFEFKKDGSVASNGTAISGYTWKFSSDKSSVEETFTMGSSTVTSSTKIMRLTSKDLWTQSTGSTTVDKYVAQ